jgi:hypothetical protein
MAQDLREVTDWWCMQLAIPSLTCRGPIAIAFRKFVPLCNIYVCDGIRVANQPNVLDMNCFRAVFGFTSISVNKARVEFSHSIDICQPCHTLQVFRGFVIEEADVVFVLRFAAFV